MELCIDFMHVAASTSTFKYSAFLRKEPKHDSGQDLSKHPYHVALFDPPPCLIAGYLLLLLLDLCGVFLGLTT